MAGVYLELTGFPLLLSKEDKGRESRHRKPSVNSQTPAGLCSFLGFVTFPWLKTREGKIKQQIQEKSRVLRWRSTPSRVG